MGHIREYYERIIKLQETEWKFIASHFDRKVFVKIKLLHIRAKQKTIFHLLKQVSFGFISDDPDRHRNELTFNFCFAKEFTCAYNSFLTQTPSEYELQVLTETVVWQISYENLQNVYAQTKVGNHLGRFVSEKLFLAKAIENYHF